MRKVLLILTVLTFNVVFALNAKIFPVNPNNETNTEVVITYTCPSGVNAVTDSYNIDGFTINIEILVHSNAYAVISPIEKTIDLGQLDEGIYTLIYSVSDLFWSETESDSMNIFVDGNPELMPHTFTFEAPEVAYGDADEPFSIYLNLHNEIPLEGNFHFNFSDYPFSSLEILDVQLVGGSGLESVQLDWSPNWCASYTVWFSNYSEVPIPEGDHLSLEILVEPDNSSSWNDYLNGVPVESFIYILDECEEEMVNINTNHYAKISVFDHYWEGCIDPTAENFDPNASVDCLDCCNWGVTDICYSSADCDGFPCISAFGDCNFENGPGTCDYNDYSLIDPDCYLYPEDPVCSCNGQTYFNECEALFGNGTGVAYEGECETENTECYTNSDCDGFPCISAFGDCNFENGPGTCDYMNYSLVDPHCYLYPEDPVCSCNGQTYLNECDALFGNGTGIAYVGECEQDPQPGDECELEDGEIGFYDCLTLNCHPVDQLEFLGDDNCQDGMWDFSLDCPEFGYDCGDCNADWDGSDPLGFCEDDFDGPTWHISTDGSDETGDGSVENPFATIQHGINTAVDGDTVLVAPGTYFENINFLGKNISIIGEDKETTIIDGNQIGSVVTFENGEDSTAVLNRFTIQNGIGGGRPFDFFGGGITCTQSNPILRNLIISNNNTYFGGSAIACFQGSPQLDNIIIQNNNHTGFGEAGTIYAVLNSNINIENVTITENEMTWGTGLFVWNSNVNLDKVTIYGNNADDHGGGIMIAENARLSIKNSILWNNTPQEIWIADEYLSNELDISYSNIQGGIDSIIINNNGTINWLEGNINTDPLFTDSENGDYTLQPNSPCIDAGDPNSPLDPDGTVADMGAFYFDQLSITNIPDKMIPQKLYLSDGFPNPFNPIIKFEFGVPLLNSGGFGMSDVLLNVYDIRGVLIKNLINENYKPGNYSVIWNAEDLPSGVYLIRLQIGNESILTKVSLLK